MMYTDLSVIRASGSLEMAKEDDALMVPYWWRMVLEAL